MDTFFTIFTAFLIMFLPLCIDFLKRDPDDYFVIREKICKELKKNFKLLKEINKDISKLTSSDYSNINIRRSKIVPLFNKRREIIEKIHLLQFDLDQIEEDD